MLIIIILFNELEESTQLLKHNFEWVNMIFIISVMFY